MSEVIGDLIRLGMNQGSSAVEIGSRGLPQVSVGRPVTWPSYCSVAKLVGSQVPSEPCL